MRFQSHCIKIPPGLRSNFISNKVFSKSETKAHTEDATIKSYPDFKIGLALIDSSDISAGDVIEADPITQSFTGQVAQETQTIEREIDLKYRQATMKLLAEVSNTKELLLMKDVIEGIEEMADKCQKVSDSFILLALSL